jgi:hypothetical protein
MKKIVIASSLDKKNELISYLGKSAILQQGDLSRVVLAEVSEEQQKHLSLNGFKLKAPDEEDLKMSKLVLFNKECPNIMPIDSLAVPPEQIRRQKLVANNTKFKELLATISLDNYGKNVDVVIADDSCPPRNHPEFLSNDNNSGISRVQSIDWYMSSRYNQGIQPGGDALPFTPDGVGDIPTYYFYEQGRSYETHGVHVTGIACGNTHGWAKESNVYFCHFLDNKTTVINGDVFFTGWRCGETILNFHANKPANPVTGSKNPTIVNMSFGVTFPNISIPHNAIKRINYRGQNYERPSNGWNASDLVDNFGILINTNLEIIPHGLSSDLYDSYVDDMIQAGIIVVAAAGNTPYKMDVPGGIDYDNYYTLQLTTGESTPFYYHRGSSPANSNSDVIVVGSMSSSTSPEYKSYFSTTGPGITVWAPGGGIQSSINEFGLNSTFVGYNPKPDPRNDYYRVGRVSGTSMACPQITGMLACYAEREPTLTPQQAKNWLISNGKEVLADGVPGGGGYIDLQSLQGGTGKVAYFPHGSYTIQST